MTIIKGDSNDTLITKLRHILTHWKRKTAKSFRNATNRSY